MAVITATQIGKRQPVGDQFEYVYLVPVSNTAAADEWIDTPFQTILSAFTQVNTTSDRGVNIVLNARGTGVAAGTNGGDLGIEATAATNVLVTVRGRL